MRVVSNLLGFRLPVIYEPQSRGAIVKYYLDAGSPARCSRILRAGPRHGSARIIFHKPTAGGDGASERAECFLPEFSLVAFS